MPYRSPATRLARSIPKFSRSVTSEYMCWNSSDIIHAQPKSNHSPDVDQAATLLPYLRR